MNHFAKVCRSAGREDAHQGQRKPVLRQVWVEKENWEEASGEDLPPLEDIDDDGVFLISCANNDEGKTATTSGHGGNRRHNNECSHQHRVIGQHDGPGPVAETDVKPNNKAKRTRIYPFGSATPIPLRGVIEATEAKGTRRTKTKLYIAHGNVGTLLGVALRKF